MTPQDTWESVVVEFERAKLRHSELFAHLETIGDYYCEVGEWLKHGCISTFIDDQGNHQWRELPKREYDTLPPVAECIKQVRELRALSARMNELEKRKQRFGKM